MSGDPRPAGYLYSAIATNTHGDAADVIVFSHKHDSGACARIPATVYLSASTRGTKFDFPQMRTDEARKIAALLCKAADEADALDAWHARHPECVGVAS